MIQQFNNKKPVIGERTFIAENAALIGDVKVGDDASIWFNTVLRADFSSIDLGYSSNVQDNSVLHVEKGKPMTIGNHTTIGHGAIIHASKIGSNSLVGMGSILMNNTEIGDECIVGAGTVVIADSKIPSGSLIIGIPGKVVRMLDEKDLDHVKQNVREYLELKDAYRRFGQGGPDGT